MSDPLLADFARMQRDMRRMMMQMERQFGMPSLMEDLWAPGRNWMDVDQPMLTGDVGTQQRLPEAAGGKGITEEKSQTQAVAPRGVGQEQRVGQHHAGGGDWLSTVGMMGPRVDIQELPDKYLVTADIPGINKENLKVDLNTDTGVLTLSGHQETTHEQRDEGKDPNARWVRRERSSGSFTRSLRLPGDIKTDAMKAKLDHGVLRVELPRVAPKADPKMKNKAINIE